MYVGKYVPDQPDQTFGCDVLLGLELVEDERLESRRLGGGSLLPLSHFLRGLLDLVMTGWAKEGTAGSTDLDVAEEIILDGVEGDGAKDVYYR